MLVCDDSDGEGEDKRGTIAIDIESERNLYVEREQEVHSFTQITHTLCSVELFSSNLNQRREKYTSLCEKCGVGVGE